MVQPAADVTGLSPEYVPPGHLTAIVVVQYIPGGQSFGVPVPLGQ